MGTVLVALARSGVTLVRALFKALFHLSAAVSSFLSRQMELEADRFEYTLAGSATFEETFRRLRLLERVYSLLLDFNPAVLKDRVAENPGAYARILNALAKLSAGAIELERLRLKKDRK